MKNKYNLRLQIKTSLALAAASDRFFLRFLALAYVMAENPPVDLSLELNAACAECGYGIEAWSMQESSAKDFASADIELMRESETAEKTLIRVNLSLQGYQVAQKSQLFDTLDNLLKAESPSFKSRYNTLLFRKLEDVARDRCWEEEQLKG